MKHILVDGYFARNVGDDAFFYLLAKRYPHVRFSAWAPYRIQAENFQTRFNRLENRLLSKERIFRLHFSKTDGLVVIGGSMFMEGISHNPDWSRLNRPFWILGANFGPYRSEAYFQKHAALFARARDVSFREKDSADLFALEQVRWNPDLLFGLRRDPVPKKKQVFFSVMDLPQPEYRQMLEWLAEFYLRQGYRVILGSFCALQKDDQAVQRLYKSLEDLHGFQTEKGRVTCWFYDGTNLEELFSILDESEIVVASRFHAIILGLICHCQVLPVAYSQKTIHVLKQLGYDGWLLPDASLSLVKKRMSDPGYLSLNDQALDELAAKAEKHFQSLDEYLNYPPE